MVLPPTVGEKGKICYQKIINDGVWFVKGVSKKKLDWILRQKNKNDEDEIQYIFFQFYDGVDFDSNSNNEKGTFEVWYKVWRNWIGFLCKEKY